MHRSVCYWLYECFREIAIKRFHCVMLMVLFETIAPFTQKTEVGRMPYLSFSSSFAISRSYFACSSSYSF